MFLFFLSAFSLGLEAGYGEPAINFNNLNAGPGLAIFVRKDFGISDISFMFQTDFYQGKNTGYSFSLYGMSVAFSKTRWRFSPLIEFGADYISRGIKNAKESGYVFAYGLGILVNFQIERLHLYPIFSYDGITDFRKQAGFLGFRLGIDYEM